jgi:hypothetical protein
MLLEVGIEPSKVLADFAAFRTLLRTKPLDEIAFFVLNTLFRHWSDRGQLSLLVGFGLMFEKCPEMKLANHWEFRMVFNEVKARLLLHFNILFQLGRYGSEAVLDAAILLCLQTLQEHNWDVLAFMLLCFRCGELLAKLRARGFDAQQGTESVCDQISQIVGCFWHTTQYCFWMMTVQVDLLRPQIKPAMLWLSVNWSLWEW